MAFLGRSAEEQKLEFVRLAAAEEVPFAALCLRFGIGRTCGYKWRGRYLQVGEAGLQERSRRPLSSPRRSAPDVEAGVLELRTAHPARGGRKIARVLDREAGLAVAASTVTGILRLNGVPLGSSGGGLPAPERFEHEAPNLSWQMDFKGHVALAQNGGPERRPRTARGCIRSPSSTTIRGMRWRSRPAATNARRPCRRA